MLTTFFGLANEGYTPFLSLELRIILWLCSLSAGPMAAEVPPTQKTKTQEQRARGKEVGELYVKYKLSKEPTERYFNSLVAYYIVFHG